MLEETKGATAVAEPTAEPSAFSTEAQEPPPTSAETAEAAEAEEPVPPAWASLTSWDELAEHDDIKPHLEERERLAREAAYTEAQGAMESYVSRQTDSVTRSVTLMEDFAKQLKRAGKNGLSEEVLEEFMDEHGDKFQQAISIAQGHERQAGFASGVLGLVRDIADEMGQPDLYSQFEPRVKRYFQGYGDSAALRRDLVSAMVKKGVDAWVAKERPKIEKEIAARMEKEAKHEGREGEPKPKAPKAGGGGALNRKAVEKMSAEDIAKLSSEEFAAAMSR